MRLFFTWKKSVWPDEDLNLKRVRKIVNLKFDSIGRLETIVIIMPRCYFIINLEHTKEMKMTYLIGFIFNFPLSLEKDGESLGI